MILRKELLQNRRLYLIVNITPTHRPVLKDLKAILRSGVDIIQLRCKDISDSLFLEYSLLLRNLSRIYKVIFIVNNRPDIAVASCADGLHIGQEDIPPRLARRFIGEKMILGLSVHSLKELHNAALREEIDYLGIGPIFETTTKKIVKPVGLRLLNYASNEKGIQPFFAIGGINENNIKDVIAAGAKRIAISGAVFNSKKPVMALRRLRMITYDTD